MGFKQSSHVYTILKFDSKMKVPEKMQEKKKNRPKERICKHKHSTSEKKKLKTD